MWMEASDLKVTTSGNFFVVLLTIRTNFKLLIIILTFT